MIKIRYLSLGGGVQSSTLALMFARGQVANHAPPDVAIFADTGAEPQSVYEWLDYLEPLLPFPVHRVMEGNGLTRHIVESISGARFAGAPFHTSSPNGGGMLRRQCTNEFKIKPITQKIRELLGLKYRQVAKRHTAIGYIGISWDEVQRMKPSRSPWIDHEWPLIDLRMTRVDCIEWLQAQGHPRPPKSSCYFCPFRSNREWANLRENDPEDWARAVEMDKAIRSGVRGTREKLYLHHSRRPLGEIKLLPEDSGQMNWITECEGMCGV